MAVVEHYPFPTLPDYLAPSLAVVFVGINPGLYSVQRGHYFARKTSRFWPAFSQSRLSAPARLALGRELLTPEDDASLLAFGIGFTDVVKLPSGNAAALRPADFDRWAPVLLAHLDRYQPRVACFHGLTGFRAFARYALRLPPSSRILGPQPERLHSTLLYVVPNPSPANAHFRPADYTHWYDLLADFLSDLSTDDRSQADS